MFQVSNFEHYKALYMLIETYIKQRDAQNPYDYLYSIEEELNRGARLRAGLDRTSVVSYYADAPPNVPEYIPTENITIEGGDGLTARGRVDSIESFYDDEVENVEVDGMSR